MFTNDRHVATPDTMRSIKAYLAKRARRCVQKSEIERRSGNRLAGVAEVLANHYSQTN
jgi:hypothetical protein